MSQKNLTSECVLIDDDELIHFAWSRIAEKQGVILTCFDSVDEFLANQSNFTKDVIIYIDSHLSEELRGEVEAQKIFQAGFETIFLTTGYAKSDVKLDGCPWIKDIVSKRPPF